MDQNSTFFAEWLFAGEANMYSDYKYKIDPINCNNEKNISLNGNYLALGGTINFDTSPQIMLTFVNCTIANYSSYNVAYKIPNPFSNLSGGAPPLEILNRSH